FDIRNGNRYLCTHSLKDGGIHLRSYYPENAKFLIANTEWCADHFLKFDSFWSQLFPEFNVMVRVPKTDLFFKVDMNWNISLHYFSGYPCIYRYFRRKQFLKRRVLYIMNILVVHKRTHGCS